MQAWYGHVMATQKLETLIDNENFTQKKNYQEAKLLYLTE